ncbi:MAG: hypothetical protein ACYSUT_04935 [Planctomycetota bacterium]|jgi:hypothetical protein
MTKKTNLIIYTILILVSAVANGSINSLEAQKIVDLIIESEGQLHDISAKVSNYNLPSNSLISDINWGYKEKKEFLDCSDYESGEVLANVYYAFDGKVLTVLRQNKNDPRPFRGGISSFDPAIFNSSLTPNTLLGYSIKHDGHETLGEVLSKAESIAVCDRFEEIHNSNCYVIEVQGIKIHERRYDLLVWIDPERDYRPCKIEKYKDFGRAKKWQVITERVKVDDLMKIKDIWVPVSGTRELFMSRITCPESMSLKEFQYLPESEQNSRGIVSTKSRGIQGIRADIESIEVNAGISDEKFSVEFPQGCGVWDEFTNLAYTVGGRHGAYEVDNNIKEIGNTKVKTNPLKVSLDNPTNSDLSNKQNLLEEVHKAELKKTSGTKIGQKKYYIYAIMFILLFAGSCVLLNRRDAKKDGGG